GLGGEPRKSILKGTCGRVWSGMASWETHGFSPWAGGLARNLVTNLFYLTEVLQKSMVVHGCGALAMEESWEAMPRPPLQICFQSAYRARAVVSGVTKRSKCWTWRRRDFDENSWIVERWRFVSLTGEWAGRQGTDNIYHLIIQLLDANQSVLDHFSSWRNNVSFEVNHVFSNFKKGVRFESCEHWVQDVEFLSEQYGVYLPNSSVIVRSWAVLAKRPDRAFQELGPLAGPSQ
ncbi:hypothetical protein E2I00_018095, partial [Balaenoptera physalus]